MLYENNILVKKEKEIRKVLSEYFEAPTSIELSINRVSMSTNTGKFIGLNFCDWTINSKNVLVSDIQYFMTIIEKELYNQNEEVFTLADK